MNENTNFKTSYSVHRISGDNEFHSIYQIPKASKAVIRLVIHIPVKSILKQNYKILAVKPNQYLVYVPSYLSVLVICKNRYGNYTECWHKHSCITESLK